MRPRKPRPCVTGVWHDKDPFLLSSHRRQAYAYFLPSIAGNCDVYILREQSVRFTCFHLRYESERIGHLARENVVTSTYARNILVHDEKQYCISANQKISRKKEYHKHYIYLISPPPLIFFPSRSLEDRCTVGQSYCSCKDGQTALTKATLKLLYYSQKWSFKYISYKTCCHF